MDQDSSRPEVLRVVDALHRRVDSHDRTIVKIETQIEGLDRRFDTQALALADMRASQQAQAQSAARTEEAITWIKNELTRRVVASEASAQAAVTAAKDAEVKTKDGSGKGAWGLAAGVVSLLTVMASTIYELATR